MSELIKISKEFKGAMGGVWLGIETEVHAEKEQDIIDAFKEKNELLEKAWMSMNPQINWSDSYAPIAGTSMSPSTIVPIPPKESAIESHIKTINECKTLNNLKIFEKLVKNTNDDSLSNAYMKKHEELYKQKSVTS